MKYTALVFFLACYIGVAPVPAGPLLDAARTGNNRQLDRILKSKVDIRERGPHGETALHWMAFHGNEAMVRRLIDAGADVNDTVAKGSTPLHLAAYNGHTGVVKLLIEHGAKVNARTRFGITPLDWAKRNGHSEVAQLLIAHNAKDGQNPSSDGAIADHEQTGKENNRSHAGIAPLGREKRNGQGEIGEPLIADNLKAGRTPSSDGVAAGHRKIRLGDLKYYPEQDQIPIKYLLSQAPQSASVLTGAANTKIDYSDNPSQAASFRIQLAALSSEQRAAEAWMLYRRRHPDILEDLELMLEAVSLKGKRLYRVQAGLLTRRNAQLMCDQLKRRSQPCIVISSEAL